MNRVNALYDANSTGYRKFPLYDAPKKKVQADTTAAAMRDRVTFSPEAIRQAARPSTPLEDQIIPSRSAHPGIYDRRSLQLRR